MMSSPPTVFFFFWLPRLKNINHILKFYLLFQDNIILEPSMPCFKYHIECTLILGERFGSWPMSNLKRLQPALFTAVVDGSTALSS